MIEKVTATPPLPSPSHRPTPGLWGTVLETGVSIADASLRWLVNHRSLLPFPIPLPHPSIPFPHLLPRRLRSALSTFFIILSKLFSMLQGDAGDSVIVGGTSLSHLESNLRACKGPPLSPSLLDAFDRSWAMTRAACPPYYR